MEHVLAWKFATTPWSDGARRAEWLELAGVMRSGGAAADPKPERRPYWPIMAFATASAAATSTASAEWTYLLVMLCVLWPMVGSL